MSLAPRKARLKTAGAAPGSIIAAIIGSYNATKDANELSRPQRPCPFVYLPDIDHILRSGRRSTERAPASIATDITYNWPISARLGARL
jgi:hypothetical protein